MLKVTLYQDFKGKLTVLVKFLIIIWYYFSLNNVLLQIFNLCLKDQNNKYINKFYPKYNQKWKTKEKDKQIYLFRERYFTREL